jgi:membrane-bound ClpP family serine protease
MNDTAMKIITYLTKRLIIFVLGIICFWFGAYYTLPRYIREDGFGFMAELDRFFTLSFAFSILFMIYTFNEIYKFKKIGKTKSTNTAICLSIFAFIATITFFVFDRIYS